MYTDGVDTVFIARVGRTGVVAPPLVVARELQRALTPSHFVRGACFYRGLPPGSVGGVGTGGGSTNCWVNVAGVWKPAAMAGQ